MQAMDDTINDVNHVSFYNDKHNTEYINTALADIFYVIGA